MKDIEKMVGDLIDKSDIAIISSVDHEGYPNTKAMLAVRKRDGIENIYFSTHTSSVKAKNFKSNPKACLYFFDKESFIGIMLKGTMEVLEDSDSKVMIWREGDTLYHPKGASDPDYCVLKFKTLSGRKYSNFNSEDFNI